MNDHLALDIANGPTSVIVNTYSVNRAIRFGFQPNLQVRTSVFYFLNMEHAMTLRQSDDLMDWRGLAAEINPR